ncbi:protein phosphatase 1 regulatory subunit 42-like isoform X4 [Argiope bruennichi]|uniref:protein phosphatase 1 regulatory subunit 42-like isoform X4 n=1 Tax=Argiope bruennichi TaxID=94029 RepID=UPI0024954986|nr:protein phosphatase 1 regulatory subunit 42-like isoform X4 [Argiope bruennichi]
MRIDRQVDIFRKCGFRTQGSLQRGDSSKISSTFFFSLPPPLSFDDSDTFTIPRKLEVTLSGFSLLAFTIFIYMKKFIMFCVFSGTRCMRSKEKRKMKINTELIQRCSSKNLLPVQGGGDIMDRITHLYLQEQYIKKIENLHSCRNLRALYLYDNKIEKIENLEDLVHLNCLYLHKNFVRRIENLDSLCQLTVLNLSHNCITKVEGLDALCELRELYLQYQNLPEDQSLEFDTTTITWLSECLKVLNVSGNKLTSLAPLRSLEYLEHFTAEDNDICDLQDVVDVFNNWKTVRVIKLTGNPVCTLRKYRDNVVVSCLELGAGW